MSEVASPLGVWILLEADLELAESQERRHLFGANPQGALTLEPTGRMVAVLTSAERLAGSAEGELFQSMMAYSGRFIIDGNRFVTTVDVAWDPRWLGSEQVRFFHVAGDELFIRSSLTEHPLHPGRTAVATLRWRRDPASSPLG